MLGQSLPGPGVKGALKFIQHIKNGLLGIIHMYCGEISHLKISTYLDRTLKNTRKQRAWLM